MTQAEALREVDALDPASAPGKTALMALVRAGASGPALLSRLERAVATGSRTTTDIGLQLAYAQAAWSADQRHPSATRARDSARCLIELVPDLADGYRLLGLAHLSRGEYREAFLALTALMALPGAAGFENLRALARHLMMGTAQVSFELDGERYTFDLTTHNAAAIACSAVHSVGALTEWEELQYLARTLRRPQHIVEVGVLLGNHTAFFLKQFAPRDITLIDADPANVIFIRRTAACNLPPGPLPDVQIQWAYVGADATSAVNFAGARVPQRSLATLVSGPVDFLKVSVGGNELAVLAGAAPVIERHRPAVMIRTIPTTHDDVLAWFAARSYDVGRVFDRDSHRNVVLTTK